MILINYPAGRQPSEEWLTRAKALTEQLEAAADRPARDKIIDDNAALWGEVKEWLMTFSDDNCWFSEAKDVYSHWHVEHFRPKKEAKDPDRDGYWWRAFDYLNYRLCGSVGNAKKGSYFPLRPGSAAATCPTDNCDDEAPLLLDPTRADDVILLTFAETGRAVAAESAGWLRERAERSIERYKLNDHPPLLRARSEVWNQCKVKIDEMETLLAKQQKSESPTRKERIRKLVSELKEMTRRRSQFSSAAHAFIDQDQRAWVKRCAA